MSILKVAAEDAFGLQKVALWQDAMKTMRGIADKMPRNLGAYTDKARKFDMLHTVKDSLKGDRARMLGDARWGANNRLLQSGDFQSAVTRGSSARNAEAKNLWSRRKEIQQTMDNRLGNVLTGAGDSGFNRGISNEFPKLMKQNESMRILSDLNKGRAARGVQGTTRVPNYSGLY